VVSSPQISIGPAWQGSRHPHRLTGQSARACTAAFPIPHLFDLGLGRRPGLLDSGVVSSPRISILPGPAGFRINRDYMRGEAGLP